MSSEHSRRDFLTKSALAGMAMAIPVVAHASNHKDFISPDVYPESKLIVPKGNAIPITGTFLDEISQDIPHQNWGEKSGMLNLAI